MEPLTIPSNKPGYQTTEFWTMVLMVVLSALVAVGVITFQDQSSLVGPLAEAAVALATLVVNAAAVWKYMQGRQTLKVEAMRMGLTLPGPVLTNGGAGFGIGPDPMSGYTPPCPPGTCQMHMTAVPGEDLSGK